MAPLGLLVQGGPVGVGRIPVNLKVFRLRATIRAGTRVGVSARSVGSGFGVGGAIVGVGGRLVGAGFVQKFVDDVAIRGVGRRDGHVGDQLVVGIDIHVGLVPIEGPGARLVPVAGLHIDGGDQPIPGHLAGDTKHPVLAGLDVLAGHQPQQLGGMRQRPVQLVAVQHVKRGLGVAHQRIDQCFTGFRVVPVARRFAQGGVVVVAGQPRAYRGRQRGSVRSAAVSTLRITARS